MTPRLEERSRRHSHRCPLAKGELGLTPAPHSEFPGGGVPTSEHRARRWYWPYRGIVSESKRSHERARAPEVVLSGPGHSGPDPKASVPTSGHRPRRWY